MTPVKMINENQDIFDFKDHSNSAYLISHISLDMWAKAQRERVKHGILIEPDRSSWGDVMQYTARAKIIYEAELFWV